MIEDIPDERFTSMTQRERRWFDNVKKAILASDDAYMSGEKKGHCFPELCKAVDTAKMLHRSLLDKDTSTAHNKKRFLEFFGGPSAADGGYESGELIDARSGKKVRYSLGGLVYAIRCMVHENENLDFDDRPDYHVLLNWSGPFRHPREVVSQFADEKLIVNAELLLGILRERVTGFVTSIDSMIAMKESGMFNITIAAPLGSIRPGENFVYASRTEET